MSLATLAVTALLLAAQARGAPAFDRPAWQADLEQLKAVITTESPNLEWTAERGLDLPALEARARRRLAAANDDAAARLALESFVRGFADGHMKLQWPSPSAGPAAATPSVCAALGYHDEPDRAAIATRLPGYRSVSPPGARVSAGTLSIDGRQLGVLRIPEFAPSAAMCEAALAQRSRAVDSPCDEACSDLVARRSDAFLLAEVELRIRALRRQNVRALLVDLAGNGGGNDTAIAIARMVGGADIPAPAVALIRGPETLRRLARDEAVLREALADAGPQQALLLGRHIETTARMRAEAGEPCDRTALWQGERASCSRLIRGLYASGLTALELPPSLRRMPWADTVSATTRYTYTASLWQGPLVVLVDANSASATELMGAMLQDSGRAVLVGSPSFGAGCGWFGEHVEFVLKNSQGRLSVPDCARFRPDGTNEIDGLQPDVLVGFRPYDSPRQRVERLLKKLPAAIKRAVGSSAAS